MAKQQAGRHDNDPRETLEDMLARVREVRTTKALAGVLEAVRQAEQDSPGDACRAKALALLAVHALPCYRELVPLLADAHVCELLYRARCERNKGIRGAAPPPAPVAPPSGGARPGRPRHDGASTKHRGMDAVEDVHRQVYREVLDQRTYGSTLGRLTKEELEASLSEDGQVSFGVLRNRYVKDRLARLLRPGECADEALASGRLKISTVERICREAAQWAEAQINLPEVV